MTDVKPGQCWADNDPRSAGRTLRVERIEGDKAVCVVLTNPTSFTGSSWQRDTRGKTTRISLPRFKPTSTGYRLIRTQQYGIRWATGSVFAFGSREDAEAELKRNGGAGVLVVHEYGPGTSNSTEWRPVAPEEG